MKFNNYPELINHHKEHIKIDWAIDEKTGIPKKSNDKEILLAHTDATEDNLEHIIKIKLVDLIYPIGSVIMTTNPDFNPSTQFGGNWTKWTDGYLKVDTTPNATVQGATDYKITKEMLPKHLHTISHTHEYTPKGEIDPLTHDHKLNYGDESKDNAPNLYNTIEITSTTQTNDLMYTQNTTLHPVFHGLPGTTTFPSSTYSGSGDFANNEYKPRYYAVIAWQRTP